jgi:hypothetical protein
VLQHELEIHGARPSRPISLSPSECVRGNVQAGLSHLTCDSPADLHDHKLRTRTSSESSVSVSERDGADVDGGDYQ